MFPITRLLIAQVKGDFLEHRNQKVKWDAVIKPSAFWEMEGMRYRLTNTIIAVAPNGGFIAITIDRTVTRVSHSDSDAFKRQASSKSDSDS